jgi:hypothetical protein
MNVPSFGHTISEVGLWSAAVLQPRGRKIRGKRESLSRQADVDVGAYGTSGIKDMNLPREKLWMLPFPSSNRGLLIQ